jgi:hypothetical protein
MANSVLNVTTIPAPERAGKNFEPYWTLIINLGMGGLSIGHGTIMTPVKM